MIDSLPIAGNTIIDCGTWLDAHAGWTVTTFDPVVVLQPASTMPLQSVLDLPGTELDVTAVVP